MKPDWLELLAPLPPDVTPVRKPVLSAELIASGTAGPVADWVSLSINLSAPEGSRHVLITLDGDGKLLSAGDHVMFISRASRLDRPIAAYEHHSVGGRYADDGSFHGTRWLTHTEQDADDADDEGATTSTPSAPSAADIAGLNAIVADVMRRAT